jgi:hypothetical protein
VVAIMASSVEKARQERQRIVMETPVPAPEMPSQRIALDELPLSPRTLLQAAILAGFRVQAWESRGPRIGADGQPLDIRNAIGVRGQHPDGAVFRAMWIQDVEPSGKKNVCAWKLDFIQLYDRAGSRRANSADLKAFLSHDREEVPVL